MFNKFSIVKSFHYFKIFNKKQFKNFLPCSWKLIFYINSLSTIQILTARSSVCNSNRTKAINTPAYHQGHFSAGNLLLRNDLLYYIHRPKCMRVSAHEVSLYLRVHARNVELLLRQQTTVRSAVEWNTFYARVRSLSLLSVQPTDVDKAVLIDYVLCRLFNWWWKLGGGFLLRMRIVITYPAGLIVLAKLFCFGFVYKLYNVHIYVYCVHDLGGTRVQKWSVSDKTYLFSTILNVS